ncbi:hypothetical protein MIT9_P0516 [Methylomarinovum caldicuralii]|uniref:Integron cassette protein n=1 Tax=Methylomarinovum caldicuralii TaxID=438856 RepID=A0AAU9C071_9GAMM|nr:DUF2442 domain-containing protein [Methylomarinovum caldicuralii]BCX80938.1 hypothetical protein MIT9_P0516 [Methylomarinovum caldicuralii]
MQHSSTPGKHTSGIEVTGITEHGIWILFHGREYFLAYDDFPWFRDQPSERICHVQEITPGHLYWPDLDVDLSLEIIEHPERFPLLAT